MKFTPKRVFIYGSSCCLPEINTLFLPTYDLERLSFYLVSSPKNADIIIIAGELFDKEQEELKILSSQNKKIIAVGNCQIKRNTFDFASVGCPPRPETIIETILESQNGN